MWSLSTWVLAQPVMDIATNTIMVTTPRLTG
jgi:hypothetical protein